MYDEEFRKFPGSGLWTLLTGITNKPTFNPQWILGILPIAHHNYNVVSSRKTLLTMKNNSVNVVGFNISLNFVLVFSRITTASVPILFVTVQRSVSACYLTCCSVFGSIQINLLIENTQI